MKNGTCWTDDSGKLIQAHGGCIRNFGGKWYWYGENKDTPNCVNPDGTASRRVDGSAFPAIRVTICTAGMMKDWR